MYDETESDPPFAKLFPLLARFILLDDGRIGEFYFNDQQGKDVITTEPLDLSHFVIPFGEENNVSNPFSWKGDNDDDQDEENDEEDIG